MAVIKSREGYVVVVRGWGFVTASALMKRQAAVRLMHRLCRSGEKARLERRSA